MWYPKASRVQDFSQKYSSTTMNTDTVTLHSTEGTGWPGYGGGASAPNLTVMADFKNEKAVWRQHFPVNGSARALENRSGGVQTNTQNTCQIEIVGTCDPRAHTEWSKKGIQHLYTPELPDWFLRDLYEFMVWLHEECPKFVPIDGAPRGWGAYPASYGNSKYRMSFAEWNNAKGIIGHQHIPENSHGDPGAFPIKRLLSFGTTSPVPAPAPPTHIEDPSMKVLTRVVSYNVASLDVNAHGNKTAKTRIPKIGLAVGKTNPDICAFQELPKDLVSLMVSSLNAAHKDGRFKHAPNGADGRHLAFNKKKVRYVASGIFEASKSSLFEGDDKQAAWLVYEKRGVRGMEVSFHTENEDGAIADQKRVAQMDSFLSQAINTAREHKVAIENLGLNGDANSLNAVRKRMAEKGWQSNARVAKIKRNTKYQSFLGWFGKKKIGDPLDYQFSKLGVEVKRCYYYLDSSLSDHARLVSDKFLVKKREA